MYVEEKITYGIGDPYPSYTSIDENAAIMLQRSDEAYRHLMESTGMDELASFLEYGEVIHESVGDIIDSIIQWLKDRFADFKRLVDQALKEIKAKIDKFVSKVKEKVAGGAQKLADKLRETGAAGDITFGIYYDYKELDKFVSGNDRYTQAFNALEKMIRDNGDKISSFKEGRDSAYKAVANRLQISKEEFTISDLKKAIKEEARGKEYKMTVAMLKSNIKDIVANATDFGKAKKRVSLTYNDIKKEYDIDIKWFESKRKNAVKSENDDKADSLSEIIAYTRACRNMANAAGATIINVIAEQSMLAMRILAKLVTYSANKKNTTKYADKLKESTFEPGSIQSELVSLFDF